MTGRKLAAFFHLQMLGLCWQLLVLVRFWYEHTDFTALLMHLVCVSQVCRYCLVTWMAASHHAVATEKEIKERKKTFLTHQNTLKHTHKPPLFPLNIWVKCQWRVQCRANISSQVCKMCAGQSKHPEGRGQGCVAAAKLCDENPTSDRNSTPFY